MFFSRHDNAQRPFVSSERSSVNVVGENCRFVAEIGVQFGKSEGDFIAISRFDDDSKRQRLASQLVAHRRARPLQNLRKGRAFILFLLAVMIGNFRDGAVLA